MFTLKHKLLVVLSCFALLSVGLAGTAGAAPIPAGCPGSTLQGPPGPGICEAIPTGCPGSTRQGPPAPGTTCPYEAAGSGSSNSSGTSLKGDCKNSQNLREDCAVIGYLVDFIRVLSTVVGIVVVIMIVVGGIQYSSSRDNPQATAAAKGRITNAIIALVAYLFMFAILQYLVPGGVL